MTLGTQFSSVRFNNNAGKKPKTRRPNHPGRNPLPADLERIVVAENRVPDLIGLLRGDALGTPPASWHREWGKLLARRLPTSRDRR
ncbi:MAG: hypothetical protein V3V08_00265, partial [Nannocystaceae bacterium]